VRKALPHPLSCFGESQKSQCGDARFDRSGRLATRDIARMQSEGAVHQEEGQPMPNSFHGAIDAELRLKANYAAHLVVGVSSLAATMVLLARVLPPLLIGFP